VHNQLPSMIEPTAKEYFNKAYEAIATRSPFVSRDEAIDLLMNSGLSENKAELAYSRIVDHVANVAKNMNDDSARRHIDMWRTIIEFIMFI
jgi:hypothetical protein